MACEECRVFLDKRASCTGSALSPGKERGPLSFEGVGLLRRSVDLLTIPRLVHTRVRALQCMSAEPGSRVNHGIRALVRTF